MAKQTTKKTTAKPKESVPTYTVTRHRFLKTYYMAKTKKLKLTPGQKVFEVVGTATSKREAAKLVNKHRNQK